MLPKRMPDPCDPVVLRANNPIDPADVDTLVRGIKLSRRILVAPSLRNLRFHEFAPGGDSASDEAIERHLRSVAKTVYYPSGTCRMGRDDMAVVNNQLWVIGVPHLRVADASVVPVLVSSNTNERCVTITERCADFLIRRG